MDIKVDERAQMLMKLLVERYISDGQPVGSKTLSQALESRVSSATVRNVMKQLEDLGLLISPHTSAGRVPTELGYRFYVDTMIHVEPLEREMAQTLTSELARHSQSGTDNKLLMQKASSLLSELTQMAGVVMLPRQASQSLSRIEFLPLKPGQVLAVLIVNNQQVQNRILTTERDYNAEELQWAANYLNQHFCGCDLQEMGKRLQDQMAQDQRDINHVMDLMVRFSGEVGIDSDTEEVMLQGEANLIGDSGIDNTQKLKQLFDAFSKKRDIAHLLDRCAQGDGLQIFIGRESGYEPFDNCSLVTAPYQSEGDSIGVLGVIGPTRMAYERVIPVVDFTARLLSLAGRDDDSRRE
ncbi:MAG: heat-inducible transcriptional repressor HrcA [Pseudomonadota bacterium]